MFGPIYPILDRQTFERAHQDPHQLIRTWLALGLTAFQIRDKRATEVSYLEFALEVKKSFPEAHIIANDFAGLALDNRSVFSALHLGQEDWVGLDAYLREKVLRACHTGFALGLSTHSLSQFLSAADLKLAYTAVGPVQATSSKPTGTDPVISAGELEQILRAGASAKRQIVVIGGLNAGNLEKVLSPDRRSWFSERRPVPAVIQAALSRAELEAMLRILNV
ncbi:MAG: thiamine phosphate synthase [Leptospirales bacterium]|nr:thiamine phosphate synthase [Leptospirales bacterium]